MSTVEVRARPSADRKHVTLVLTLGGEQPIQLQLSWEGAKNLSSELDGAAETVRQALGNRVRRGGQAGQEGR